MIISSFKIINVVVLDRRTLIVANFNSIKIILANNVITFLANGNPVFSNGLRCLPRNPSD